MTEDMPTVDGARAEAERRWGRIGIGAVNGLTYPSDAVRAYQRGAFVAGAHWLAPTVAALEAEVELLREEVEQQRDAAGEWASRTTQANARADAAQAAIEQLARSAERWHDPEACPDGPAVLVADLRAALSDAAPQAVAAPEVVETAEGLDALPVGSVVLDGSDVLWHKRRDGRWLCEDGDVLTPGGVLIHSKPVTFVRPPLPTAADGGL